MQFKRLLGLLWDAEVLGVIPLDQRNLPNVSTWLGYDAGIEFTLLTKEYLNLRKTNSGALDEYRKKFVGEVNASRGIEVTGFKSVGNYIGRTTRGGKMGDVIAVLYGSQLPVVLRQLESGKGLCYQFIGPCCVKGLMFGEAVDASEDQGMKIGRLALVWNLLQLKGRKSTSSQLCVQGKIVLRRRYMNASLRSAGS